MANNRSLLIVSILLAILSLVGSFVINIASNNLPDSWKPYVWLAYPIAGIIIVLTIVFVYWQWRVTGRQNEQSNPIQSIGSQKADAIYNAPGGTINVNKENDKGALHHEKEIVLPKLELKLIDKLGKYSNQLTYVQTQYSQYFQFGIALVNTVDESLPAEKMDIRIECSWDGNDIEKAPQFKAETSFRLMEGWVTTRQDIRQGNEPLPAILDYHGSSDTRCAFGHPLEWRSLAFVLINRMGGRFLLNYSISSVSPVTRSEGQLIIVIDSEKFGTKEIILKDILTGEELHIEFNLRTDKVEINGVRVKRAQALESNENQFVFLPDGDRTKMYHLSRKQIDKMKAL